VRNPRLHGYLSFAGSLLETAAKSLHLSCGSELHIRSAVSSGADYAFICDRSRRAGVLRSSWIDLSIVATAASSSKQSLGGHEDFPRHYPIASASDGGLRRYEPVTQEQIALFRGKFGGLPDKEFRYLRQLSPLVA
jgi:hypothetical protein